MRNETAFIELPSYDDVYIETRHIVVLPNPRDYFEKNNTVPWASQQKHVVSSVSKPSETSTHAFPTEVTFYPHPTTRDISRTLGDVSFTAKGTLSFINSRTQNLRSLVEDFSEQDDPEFGKGNAPASKSNDVCTSTQPSITS